jgi:hypothetical protein
MKMEGIDLFGLFELVGKGKYVLSSWKGKKYIRRYVKPKNPRTKKQLKQRKKFTDAVQAWHKLRESEKAHYNKLAERYAISGMNLFISRHVKEN